MPLQKRYFHQLALITAVMTGAYLVSNIIYSASNSTKYRFFWLTSSVPEKNDYAMFKYPDNDYLTSRDVTDPFTKRIGCVGHDSLELRNNIYYCNGKFLGIQLKKDSEGKNLPLFVYSGEIPEGKVFMVGDNPRSGDSRYFGLVDISSAKKVIPLW